VTARLFVVDYIADAYAAWLTFVVREGGLLLVLVYAFQLHRLRTVGALELTLFLFIGEVL
jgi:hypothetical protein